MASANEIQAHYWSINFRKVFDDNSVFEIHIPAVLFNYPQEVTGASVKIPDPYTGAIFWEYGDKCKEKAIQMMNDYKEFDYLMNYGFSKELSCVNSIHKHPGSLSVFSSTDYSKDMKEPGICYPCQAGENVSSYSSILLMKDKGASLGRTEFRTFTDIDNLLAYEKGRTIAFTREEAVTISEVETFFGIGEASPVNLVAFFDELTDAEYHKLYQNALIAQIRDIWLKSEFVADTIDIDSKHITERKVVYSGTFSNKSYGRTLPHQTKIYDYTPKEEGSGSLFDQQFAPTPKDSKWYEDDYDMYQFYGDELIFEKPRAAASDAKVILKKRGGKYGSKGKGQATRA